MAACKEVLEGVCWVGNGNDNGETVYFQTKGKQLSTMVVSKMILTAKSAVGRHYDFQIPSAEEEQRVAALAEGVGEEGHGGTTEIPTAPPKQPTSTPNLEAAYVARANALIEDLKKAVASGTPAGNEAKLRFAESQVLVRKKELSEAIAMLGVVEEQIKKADLWGRWSRFDRGVEGEARGMVPGHQERHPRQRPERGGNDSTSHSGQRAC